MGRQRERPGESAFPRLHRTIIKHHNGEGLAHEEQSLLDWVQPHMFWHHDGNAKCSVFPIDEIPLAGGDAGCQHLIWINGSRHLRIFKVIWREYLDFSIFLMNLFMTFSNYTLTGTEYLSEIYRRRFLTTYSPGGPIGPLVYTCLSQDHCSCGSVVSFPLPVLPATIHGL